MADFRLMQKSVVARKDLYKGPEIADLLNHTFINLTDFGFLSQGQYAIFGVLILILFRG